MNLIRCMNSRRWSMKLGRGSIDKISSVLGQNLTFTSIWHKKKEGRESPEQQQTLPPRVGFSSPNCQYHPILIVPFRCRNSRLLASVCTIGRYSRKGKYVLRAAVFPDFSSRLVLRLQRRQRLRLISYCDQSFGSWLSNLLLISNFPCTHNRSILWQLRVKSSSCFEFYFHP